MNPITLLLILFGSAYAILIFCFFVGWVRLPLTTTRGEDNPSLSGMHMQEKIPFVSVVVAARNEAMRIGPLLEALAAQDHPSDRYELIIVDDHSEDGTSEVVKQWIEEASHARGKAPTMVPKLLTAAAPDDAATGTADTACTHSASGGHSPSGTHSTSGGHSPAGTHCTTGGKKHALTLGIRRASGEFILTTDADCRPAPGWISGMSRSLSDPAVQMVLGPVRLRGTHIFGQLQELEFLSLMGVAGGAVGLGNPVMGNGASLGFRRQAWQKAGGYASHIKFPSGDDVFLLHAVKKQRRQATGPEGTGKPSVHFLKDRNAIVETEAIRGGRAFFRQRGRWAGKASGYKDPFTLLTGGVVAGFNLLLVIHLVFLLVFPGISALWLLAATALKALVDFLLLAVTARFFGMTARLVWFPVIFPVYPFYVLASVFVGWARNSRW
jgi:poly-beta-1,6-N-acetyl-D-glucosamine synthase